MIFVYSQPILLKAHNKVIKISKGLDLPISGSPSKIFTDEPKVSSVAILSNDFVGMKPTMFVKEGETVKAGQKIFEDKKNLGVFIHLLQAAQ